MGSSHEERFWVKVDKKGGPWKDYVKGRCWVWTAAKNQHGYGIFSIEGKNYRAHRVAWWFEYGEWPEGELDHQCRVRACVNVAHLAHVPKGWNARQGGETSGARKRFRERCIRGHKMTLENTLVGGGKNRSGRMCRKCSNERQMYARRMMRDTAMTQGEARRAGLRLVLPRTLDQVLRDLQKPPPR